MLNSCKDAGCGVDAPVTKAIPAYEHLYRTELRCCIDQTPTTCTFAYFVADPALFFSKNCRFEGLTRGTLAMADFLGVEGSQFKQ
jgi:hypothetical protein